MATAHPQKSAFDRESLRLFTVAVTRTRHRLYLIGSRTRIEGARPGTPLAHIAPLLRTTGRTIAARYLANLPDDPFDTRRQTDLLGPVGQELAAILAEHVRVTEIQDERQFYTTFATHLRSARQTIWMWAPWTANRLKSILPVLAEAVDRGVKIVIFVRDPNDKTQGTSNSQQQLASLRAVVPAVIEVHTLHQKIVVIDERIVLLGSLNALSQSHSREVMLVMEGHHFARKLLEHEQARAMANPPRACGRCGSDTIDLRRTQRQSWQWRCYAPTDSPRPDGRRSSCGWTTPLQL
jgi:phosphatidylserine/phosphatidylglycerophosphate/cardiolipin synthase-like enzyme